MINRDEFLKMAREAGLFSNVDYHSILNFKNAILERAAVECETIEDSEEFNNELWLEDGAAVSVTSQICAKAIRALKTQGE